MPIFFSWIHVHGKVQGVWFRKYTQQKAQALGLRGTVCNVPSGRTVEVRAFSDDKEKLGEFVTWCTTVGSPKSRIDSHEVQQGELVLDASTPPELYAAFSTFPFGVTR